MPETSLVWLRRDLRLHDHEPLTRALERDGRAVPIFCFDPRDFATTFLGGFPKTGAHRARFLVESVAALRASLVVRVLARKGYPLAFIWPDGGPPRADQTDALKLEADTILSIKQFTRGRFPNGVP